MTTQKPDTDSAGDDILREAVTQALDSTVSDRSPLREFVNVTLAITWLEVLAVPRIFSRLPTVPARAHLLNQVDTFLTYVHSGRCDTEPTFAGVPYEHREPLTVHLRQLLERWSPPALPAEITAVARELLHAEGLLPPEGWDSLPDLPDRIMDQICASDSVFQ